MTKIITNLSNTDLEHPSSITPESVLNTIKNANTATNQRIDLTQTNSDGRSPIDELIHTANPFKKGSIDHVAFHLASYVTLASIRAKQDIKDMQKALSEMCAKLHELEKREKQDEKIKKNISFTF